MSGAALAPSIQNQPSTGTCRPRSSQLVDRQGTQDGALVHECVGEGVAGPQGRGATASPRARGPIKEPGKRVLKDKKRFTRQKMASEVGKAVEGVGQGLVWQSRVRLHSPMWRVRV